MSATGRSDVRAADDFYATPDWVTQAILPHLHEPDESVEGGVVVDPCAGEGAILSSVRQHANGIRACGIELDEGRAVAAGGHGHAIVVGDALDSERWTEEPIGLVITNPPYKLALEFVDRALREVAEGGEVAMLLRLNWLGSQKRAAFHKRHPGDVYILARRPSFTGGGTDATEYCWIVWGRGRGNRWQIIGT